MTAADVYWKRGKARRVRRPRRPYRAHVLVGDLLTGVVIGVAVLLGLLWWLR